MSFRPLSRTKLNENAHTQTEMEQFRWRLENGHLLAQIVEQMFGNFLKEIRITGINDGGGGELASGCVRFGMLVNLIAAELPALKGETWALSVSAREDDLGICRRINDDCCYLAVAPMSAPCARNTFRIVR